MTGGERQKAGKAGGSAIAVGVVGVFYGVGELENTKRMSSLFRGQEPVSRIYANPSFLA